MAVDVTLRFTNEEEAQRFVQESFQEYDFYLDADVINVQKVPPSYCTCPPSRNTRGFKRGKLFGWSVCTQCSKVPKRVFDNWGKLGGGFNLLPKSLRQAGGPETETRTEKEWSFLVNGND